MFDLDRYLARIGLSGRPSLRAIHRAHVTSIPFENLDPRRGVAASLEPDALFDKLVTRRRGGFCFEQNMLLSRALSAVGLEVEPMLARVGDRGTERPLTHLLLRVHEGGRAWHADVGFGRGTLVEPIPFGPGPECDQDGWRFAVEADGDELVLRSHSRGEWVDGYTFVPAPARMIDIETGSWFASTHPSSVFVNGVTAAIYDRELRAVSLSDFSGELICTELTPDGRSVTPVAPDEAGPLLAERFGLTGWTLDADRRPVPA